VRAVDPAPGETRLDRAVFLPPLPEQSGTAVPPEQSPAASSSPVSASPTTGSPR